MMVDVAPGTVKVIVAVSVQAIRQRDFLGDVLGYRNRQGQLQARIESVRPPIKVHVVGLADGCEIPDRQRGERSAALAAGVVTGSPRNAGIPRGPDGQPFARRATAVPLVLSVGCVEVDMRGGESSARWNPREDRSALDVEGIQPQRLLRGRSKLGSRVGDRFCRWARTRSHDAKHQHRENKARDWRAELHASSIGDSTNGFRASCFR